MTQFEIKKIGLEEALEYSLALIAHKGHHGLHVYNSPIATTVDKVARDIGTRHGDCKGCQLLTELENQGIITIDDTGVVKTFLNA